MPGVAKVVGLASCASLLTLLLVGAPAAEARGPGDLGRAVAEVRAEHAIPGIAVVVVRGGVIEVVEEQGLGADTPLALGSTSKQFTGLAVQQLVARHRLSLDSTLAALLPEAAGSPLADVTVAELLGHRSGIGSSAGSEWELWPRATTVRAEARRLLTLAPSHPAGARFEYSNANYTLLGGIIEHVTGLPYAKALQQLVLEPLGLERTTADRAYARQQGSPNGHYPWLGHLPIETPQPEWPLAAPSAMITSTGHDLARVLLAHLGSPSGISPAVLAAARQPLSRGSEWYEYASGWYRRGLWELAEGDAGWQDPTLPAYFEHDGSTLRTFSYLGFSPERDLGIVIIGDSSFGIDPDAQWSARSRIVHAVVGTEPVADTVDPLLAAAPFILVTLPATQAVGFAWVAAGRSRRSGRMRRRLMAALAVASNAATLAFAFWIVPSRSDQPVLDSRFLSGVPDLALSLWSSLAFTVATVSVLAARTLRRRTVRPATTAAGRAAGPAPSPIES